MLSILLILVVSYLIGSIPTSIIFSYRLKGIDIRDYGSKNSGGTNAFRVLGWKIGLTVMIIDMLKGLIPVLFVINFYEYLTLNELPAMNRMLLQIMAGMASIIGHIYTVFAGFRGGKGVSTAAGIMFGIAPVTMLIVLSVFFVFALISKYISLSSMIAAISFPVVIIIRKYAFGLGEGIDYYLYVLDKALLIHDSLDFSLIIVGSLIALIFVYTHRSNITRLIQGTENKITLFKTKNTATN